MKQELRLVALTDLHLRTPDEPVFQELLTTLQELHAQDAMDAVVHLGDTLAMLGRERHATNEEIEALLGEINGAVAEAAQVPVFAINGNHDGIGTDFFDVSLWNRAVRGKFDRGLANHEGESPYYTVDYPAQALRLVLLSVPYGSDVRAEYPTPLWAFGDAQLRWLAETALRVPEGWDVLLFCHVPVYYDHPRVPGERTLDVFTGERVARSNLSALCGWVEDREMFVDILQAFANRSVYTDPSRGIFADFAQAGRLIATIHGHMHEDSIFMPGGECYGLPNRMPCPQVVLPRGSSDAGLAIDVITVSSEGLTFHRIGNGTDRVIPKNT